jgi:hypothetical protein
MNRIHEITDLHFDNEQLVITIDKEVKRFPVDRISQKLRNATDHERNTFEISLSGYGIHWPILDEDLSIDGLLRYAKMNELQNETNR